ncbi:MAG TPA: glucose-6-phosphate isomerase, partial [Planctomycetes bacterium]|nr:glucose-6-phosphate isomerase [Planctomycetota bacterium]
MLISDTPAWKALSEHAQQIRGTHLRELLQDEARCAGLRWEVDGVLLDGSRQNATRQTVDLLVDLARDAGLTRKIKAMANGEKINGTENRAVLHMALRAPRRKSILVDGHDVVPDVHAVLERIKAFSKAVRGGQWKGATGKKLTQIVSIGIGGSYLGPEFVFEAMRTDPGCAKAAKRRT